MGVEQLVFLGTAATLAQLSNAGYFLAPLSNGDAPTLVNATAALLPCAPIYAYFSSDRPVGAFAFKPAMAVYANRTPIVSGFALGVLGVQFAPPVVRTVRAPALTRGWGGPSPLSRRRTGNTRGSS